MVYKGKKETSKGPIYCDRCGIRSNIPQTIILPKIDLGMHLKKREMKFDFCQPCIHKFLSWIIDGKENNPSTWSKYRRGE